MRGVLAAIGSAVAMALLSVGTAQAQDANPVGDADAGAQLYGTECRGCHAVSIAPTLRGVINRPIASVAAFAGYSEGLKARSGEAWTEANIDLFLADPQKFAAGTLMVKTVPEAQARADLIAYIATLPPPR